MSEIIVDCLEGLIPGSENIPVSTWDVLNELILSCFVPRFDQGDERPCEETDFREFRQKSENNFYHLKLILERTILVMHNTNDYLKPELTVALIALCGENMEKNNWNNSSIVMYNKDIIRMVLQTQNTDIRSLFSISNKFNRNELFLIKVLKEIRPKLMKETWKFFPGAVMCYQWIILNLDNVSVTHVLHEIIPTSLLLIDDHVDDNRLVGMTCINHIVDNSNKAELKYTGIGNVILTALNLVLHSNHMKIMKLIAPTIVSLISKIDERGSEAEWSRIDDMFEVLVDKIEFENNLEIKSVHLNNLQVIMKTNNFSTVRWTRRILRILEKYFETIQFNSEEYKISCFKTLQVFLEQTPSVTRLHSGFIILFLLKAAYNNISLFENKMAVSCFQHVWSCLDNLEKVAVLEELQKHYQYNELLLCINKTKD